jgi:hypothetical protein
VNGKVEDRGSEVEQRGIKNENVREEKQGEREGEEQDQAEVKGGGTTGSHVCGPHLSMTLHRALSLEL